MTGYTHVLAAIDVAEDSHAVADRAAAIAKVHGAHLTLLHVVDQRGLESGERFIPLTLGDTGPTTLPAGRSPMTDPQPLPVTIDHRPLEVGRNFLDAAARRLNDPAVSTELAASSAVGDEIVAVAKRLQVDLIVCGAHQRHGLELLFSSPVDRIVHRLPCDTLLIRLPD